ncbi:MAG: hypothetical protein PHZ05_07155 [Pygmaiobacter massiliensis]|nr:hypothetical protein [Pygmaiobacter massiliensis]
MELVLKRHRSIVEVFSELFNKKGDNIAYEEEGVIPKGEDFQIALDKIAAEIGALTPGSKLIIIDKYFTSVKCSDASQIIELFFTWASNSHIQEVDIYSDIKGNCFERDLVKRFDGTITLRLNKIPSQIHDRYWLFIQNGQPMIVSVGTSLNGLGKKLCIVQKISETDQAELIEILVALGITW